MNRLIVLLVILTGFSACQKKSDTPANAQVVFAITSPTQGQVYHAGDSVVVKATIAYPAELHGYELKITDTATGLIVYDDAEHVHSDHFDVSAAYLSSGATALALKLELIAEIDHNGTTAEQVVHYTYQP